MPRTNRHTLLSTATLICAALFFLHNVRAQQSPHGPLSIPCTDCHTTASWKELAQPMKFDHSTTSFALQGQHLTVACADCHVGGRFSGTSSACYDCHQNEYAKVLLPNHSLGRFSHDCTQCHTPSGWQPSTFQHSKTNFELIGAHRSVACASCHTNNVYAGLSRECFTCHQQAYNQTTQPNHKAAQFDRNCLACHTMSGWRPGRFDHNKTNFVLTGAHQTTECSLCHQNGRFKGLPTDCFSCHQTSFAKAVNPNHAAANFDHSCTSCHTNTAWKPATFDHRKTSFPLTGAHQTTDCASCHKNGVFKGLPADCYTCHQNDFARPVNPNHITSQLSHDCTQCHSNIVWKPSTFDHQKTIFPLTGAHQTVQCASCHTNGRYTGLPTDCYSCHQADFSKVIDPNHVTGAFDHNCSNCHTIIAWKPSTFDHNKTNFVLTGSHRTTPCASCHKNGQFKGLPSDCYTCHQTDFTKAVAPNHVTGNFDHNCSECHTNVAWKPSTFNHANTSFALTGAHQTALCESCHKNGQFKALPTDCYTCHQADFTKVTDPNHVIANFDHVCSQCHTTAVWKPSTFNHAATAFPLTGAHRNTLCSSCHKNGVFKGTATDCFTCHQNDFTRPVNPNHVTSQLSHDCTLCHSTTLWKPSTFDHQKTTFPLTGAHQTTVCSSCHTNGRYTGLPTDCFSCHQTDFTKVTEPNHVIGNFDRICTICHTTAVWKPSTFNHAATNFPLTGAHQAAVCSSCHKNGVYKGLAADCYSCHQTDFAKPVAPNHVTAQLSHDCTQCHSTTVWKPSTFDHQKTIFPLTGAHLTAQCASCHTNGRYSGLPTDCFGCHQADFTKVTDPNHVTGNFDHNCSGCHTNVAWKPATFDHNKTNFVLTGAHQTVPCASCHKNGQFKGLATDCYSCHQTNFASVASPNHVTAQFSHDCSPCHTTVVWKPSTFNHATTNFPLTGAHQTTDCLFCHKNGQFRGTPADCWSCHQGDFAKVTDPNHVTGGFDHVCTLCHTTAAWRPATFDHNKTAFPLTGAHVQTVCAKCHVGGKYAGTPADCYTCHLADFTSAKSPDHAAGQYPHECLTCHSTSVWQPSTFNHDTLFRINSHHRNRATCADCHRTPGNFKTYSCLSGCHARAHRQNEACYPCHTN